MTGNSEYDALGKLFRQQLENHQIPVDDNGWDEIKRKLGKGKKKAIIWLWSAGAMAAAASIAVLLIFRQPATDEATVRLVSQQELIDETGTTHQEAMPIDEEHELKEPVQVDVAKPAQNKARAVFQHTAKENQTDKAELIAQLESSETENTTDIQSLSSASPSGFNDSDIQSFSHSVIQDDLDVSLVEDNPEEDETATKKTEKWLLAAAFGISGYTDDHDNESKNVYEMDMPTEWAGMGSGNRYAADLSSNIQPFDYMSRDEFTNLIHRPPFSFGLTARKNIGKGVGMETGLVYTYLASHFEWSCHDVHQSLHYLGIPINMVVYLWNSKPNWRIYLSGGFMAEKGLRAVYRQERQIQSEHRITTVRSSIDGLQWSLNGGLGVNYRFEKGWGIYFEPRAGYSFDNNQPISIRTEWPVYFGIHLGLNYQL